MKEENEKEKSAETTALSTGKNTVDNIADPDKFAKMWNLAVTLARSSLVPKEFRGDPGNCLLAVNMALRLRADVFEVIQKITIVHGRPTMAAQWQIAQLNSSGLIVGELDLVYSGLEKMETAACYARAQRASDGKELRGMRISYEMAKAAGWTVRKARDGSGRNTSMWPHMWEQLLGYRAATFFIGRYFPQITAGMTDTESARDVGPASPRAASPYARPDPEEADWRDVPEDADPSPEGPEPLPERVDRLTRASSTEHDPREGNVAALQPEPREPVAAVLDPAAAVMTAAENEPVGPSPEISGFSPETPEQEKTKQKAGRRPDGKAATRNEPVAELRQMELE